MRARMTVPRVVRGWVAGVVSFVLVLGLGRLVGGVSVLELVVSAGAFAAVFGWFCGRGPDARRAGRLPSRS